MRDVELFGRKGRALEAGRGPVVVVVGSSLVRATFYRPLATTLASRFRVIVLELPGAGAGTRLAHPWGPARQAAWVRAFVRNESLSSPLVVGHSDGGPVALRLGALPELVRGIVLAGAVGARDDRSLVRVLSSRLAEVAREPLLSARTGWHLAANLAMHTRSFVTHALFSAEADEIAAARRVRVPTLLAWGHKDVTMPPRCARRFAAEIPSSHVTLMPGGHDAIATHPRAFLRALGAWLASARARRTAEAQRARAATRRSTSFAATEHSATRSAPLAGTT